MSDSFRIIAGHVSKQALLLTAGTLIRDFPVQDDQPPVEWEVQGDYDRLDEYAEVVEDFNGNLGGYGGYEFGWLLFATPLMWRYFRQQFADGVLSAPVTVYTEDTSTGGTTDGFRAVQCTLNLPRRAAELQREAGVPVWTYPLRFINGVDAPEGPDPSIEITHEGALIVSTPTTYTVTVTNDGDGATFDDTVVIVTLDADSDLDAVDATGWDVEYSTDGGSGYSPTPPGTLADTTHLRLTRAAALAAAAAAAFTFDAIPTSATTIAQGVTVSTTGDTDLLNNSDLDSAEAS